MRRKEFIRRLVLAEICDDFENVDQVILASVAERAATCGLTVERRDIVESLGVLIEEGMAKAYELSSREPFSRELGGVPTLDLVEETFRTYFYATEKGIHLQVSDRAWWPFDDDDGLLPGWQQPED